MVSAHRSSNHDPAEGPAAVLEIELRRYLRQASVLLSDSEPWTSDPEQRLLLLRRARHWAATVMLGIDQLLDVASRAAAIPNSVEEPLTPRVEIATIRGGAMSRHRSRTLSILMTVFTLTIASGVAGAEGEPCEEEAVAVASMKERDPALTSPKDTAAAEHVKAGNRSYRMGEYDAAIKSYIAAGLADDAPVVLYNLGQSYRSSNQYDKAIRQYRLFLDRGQPGKNLRALVECHVRTMTAELERAASTAPPRGPAPDGTGEGGLGAMPIR